MGIGRGEEIEMSGDMVDCGLVGSVTVGKSHLRDRPIPYSTRSNISAELHHHHDHYLAAAHSITVNAPAGVGEVTRHDILHITLPLLILQSLHAKLAMTRSSSKKCLGTLSNIRSSKDDIVDSWFRCARGPGRRRSKAEQSGDIRPARTIAVECHPISAVIAESTILGTASSSLRVEAVP
ncbi:hypothetical protein WG66_000829, partial [Moniliophthora roreri]